MSSYRVAVSRIPLQHVSEALCTRGPSTPDPCYPPWHISLRCLCPTHNTMPVIVLMFYFLKPSLNFQVNTHKKMLVIGKYHAL